MKWFWWIDAVTANYLHSFHFSDMNGPSMQPIMRAHGMTSFTSLCARPFGWEMWKVRCRNGLLSLGKWEIPARNVIYSFEMLAAKLWVVCWHCIGLREEKHLCVLNSEVCWNQIQLVNEWIIQSGRQLINHYIPITNDEIAALPLWMLVTLPYS